MVAVAEVYRIDAAALYFCLQRWCCGRASHIKPQKGARLNCCEFTYGFLTCGQISRSFTDLWPVSLKDSGSTGPERTHVDM